MKLIEKSENMCVRAHILFEFVSLFAVLLDALHSSPSVYKIEVLNSKKKERKHIREATTKEEKKKRAPVKPLPTRGQERKREREKERG